MNFESKNGFLSAVWGPAAWHYLHVMSFSYPLDPTDDERRLFATLVFSLCHVLPCRACREGLIRNLDRVPLCADDLADRVAFAHWLYRLHDEVNRMLQKPTDLSFTQVGRRHLNARIGRMCIVYADRTPRRAHPTPRDSVGWACDASMRRAIATHRETRHRKWDAAFWLFVHCVAFNYPPEPTVEQRIQYRQFFACIFATTPADAEWSRRLRTIALEPASEWAIDARHFANRHTLSKWVYDVHRVHVIDFRHALPLPKWEAFRISYEQYRAHCTAGTSHSHGGCLTSTSGSPAKCIIATR